MYDKYLVEELNNAQKIIVRQRQQPQSSNRETNRGGYE